jgi:hypothetical protein
LSGSRKISVKKQADELSSAVQEFIKCVDSLPESLFLKKMDGWTPRDVTAHLIGWNLYTIKGCQQLKKGELPFYFNDPGDDFCKVNAISVKKYNSKDKKRLLAQLNDSAEKLRRYLITIDLNDWEADFGVRYMDKTITIKNTVDALKSDFITHKKQIEKWAKLEIATLRTQ